MAVPTDEEYELIPLSPLRKMEKRLERLERNGTSMDMLRELIEIVKTNQQIVDDVVRINSEMIKNVSILSDTVNKMTGKVDEFMGRIETVDESAKEQPAAATGMEDRLAKLENRIGTLMSMAQRSAAVRRPMPSRPAIQARRLAPRV